MDICIIAPLSNSSPTYSIAGVIKTQVAMLSSHRHRITIFVNDDFEGPGFSGASLIKILPSSVLIDYKSKLNISKEHEELANEVVVLLAPRLAQFDLVFTHDLIFQGWYLPYALAVMVLSDEVEGLRWYHWIHSNPLATRRDWWNLRYYAGNHTIVYPTSHTLREIGEVFNTDSIICIPHILDLRLIYRFSDQTKDIVDLLPSLLTSDIIQVYPAATDRFEGKGVRELINLFSLLKEKGRSVCLVIANQFSSRREAKLVDPIQYYENVARRCGLELYTDFIFTSELFNGKYKDGLTQRILFELMSLSNLFVIPSKSESFGLGLLEALTAGTAICVANEHLNLPIKQYTSFDFKAVGSPDPFIDKSSMTQLADWIINDMDNNPVIKTKAMIRQAYNAVAVYNNYYKPIINQIPTPAPSSYLD